MTPTSTIYISLDYLIKISGGDTAFQKELIGIYLCESQIDLQKSKTYLEQADWNRLAKMVHKMKSSTRMFCYDFVEELLIEVEYLLLNIHRADLANTIAKVDALLQMVEQVRTQLQQVEILD